MAEFDSDNDASDSLQDSLGDEEELAEAYEALAEDRRQRLQSDLAAVEPTAATDGIETLTNAARLNADAEAAGAEINSQPTSQNDTGRPVPALPDTTSAAPVSAAAASSQPTRRVFVIDGKEYPDPDADLSITGPRSVQALYRDYFPGQLDNADVTQKTRDDGTLEVTFKRRIGTKGVPGRAGAATQAAGRGEVVITSARVASLLAALPPDRPILWDLVQQAVDQKGTVRLEYSPPATQLNLAEAQLAARTRLIELAVRELRHLRPSS